MREKYQTKPYEEWEKIMDQQDETMKRVEITGDNLDKKDDSTNKRNQDILFRKYDGSD